MISARLEQDLQSKNPAIRRKAIYRLGQNSFEILRKIILKDPSPVIRHEAAFLLGKNRSEKSVALLIQVIKTDQSDLVRHEAIEALGDMKMNIKKVEVLLHSLRSDKNLFIKDTVEIAQLTLYIT